MLKETIVSFLAKVSNSLFVCLFLTQSHRGPREAGHLAAAKRKHLQEALLWPHSRSPCAACQCLVMVQIDQKENIDT